MTKEKLMLNSSRKEAKVKLLERIDKAHQIIPKIKAATILDFQSVQDEYFTWDDYNTELLKQLFTTHEISDTYSWLPPVFTLGENKHISEEIASLSSDIEKSIKSINNIISKLELYPEALHIKNPETIKPITNNSKVFIVHGHDGAAKFDVARFIDKIGFEAIILHEQANASQTIIEKIEEHTDVGFGVVIYTPCDSGSLKSNSPKYRGRARQNVVFEHGFLIGKLGRSNVCQLVKGDVETPSDISGIIYTAMNDESWKLKLAKELKNAGYTVDLNKVL